jgi:DUF177 domain-containing protein
MLSYNVAGLLRDAPGSVRTYPVEVPHLPIAEDVELAAPIAGEVKLSRTGRGILARGRLDTALVERCSRCLTPIVSPVDVQIDEEALPSIDIDSGQPVDLSAEPDTLRIDAHHELNLEAAVRDAISLAEPIAPLCRPDCLGLCLICGLDLNGAPDHGHPDDETDPRLAPLAGLLEQPD